MWIVLQVLLAGALAGAWVTAPSRPLDPLLRASFGLLLGLALVLAVTARVHLGPSFRVWPVPRPEAPLVTTGIYRHLRHPMYTAVLTGVLAAVIHRPSVWTAAAALANLVLYLRKARFEEELLAARHPEYAAYRERTRGVVPWRRG